MFVDWLYKSIGSVWFEKLLLDEFVFTPNSTCCIGCVCEPILYCLILSVWENVFFPLLL